MLKLKINIKFPQLLCIVVSVAQNGEFERFGGFCVDCYYHASNQRGANSVTVAPWHTKSGLRMFESCIFRKLFGGQHLEFE